MVDFDQINFIFKLRIYSRHIQKYHVLLYLECYKKLQPKGVNILLGQPVHIQNVFLQIVSWFWFALNISSIPNVAVLYFGFETSCNLYLLCPKILHCYITPFLKYYQFATPYFFLDTQYIFSKYFTYMNLQEIFCFLHYILRSLYWYKKKYQLSGV